MPDAEPTAELHEGFSSPNAKARSGLDVVIEGAA